LIGCHNCEITKTAIYLLYGISRSAAEMCEMSISAKIITYISDWQEVKVSC